LREELPAVPPVSAGTNTGTAGVEAGKGAPNTSSQTPSSTEQNGQTNKGGKEWSVSGLVDSIIAGAVSFGDSISAFLKSAVSSIGKWIGLKGDEAGDAVKKAAEKANQWLMKKSNGFKIPTLLGGVNLSGIKVSSKFGMRMHPKYHEMRQHNGVDIPFPNGTPIVADENCESVKITHSDGGGYCAVVKLKNGDEERFLHVKAQPIGSERTLKPGDEMAFVSNSGTSVTSSTPGGDGSHMHYEYLVNGEHVDPMPHLPKELRA
jgi:murein DD-endopeptidase MepM/ murein hydrolase activator NlpD